MMGEQKSEAQLFNYAVNLEKRVRANHPLRQIKAPIDFGFVREVEKRGRIYTFDIAIRNEARRLPPTGRLLSALTKSRRLDDVKTAQA